MKSLRAGTLRHRTNITARSSTTGARGQRTGTDTVKVYSWPCSIETLSGREGELARQVFPSATLKVVGRYPGLTVTTEHFLKFGTRTLEIGHVNNVDQLNDQIELLCGEAT